jgi:hypothetical protein
LGFSGPFRPYGDEPDFTFFHTLSETSASGMKRGVLMPSTPVEVVTLFTFLVISSWLKLIRSRLACISDRSAASLTWSHAKLAMV